jgi:hypothetical protein
VALDESSHEHRVQYIDDEWEFVGIKSEDYFLRIESEELMTTFRSQLVTSLSLSERVNEEGKEIVARVMKEGISEEGDEVEFVSRGVEAPPKDELEEGEIVEEVR